MKKIIVLMMILFSFSAFSWVQPVFFKPAPLMIQFHVYNQFNMPIICSGEAIGATRFGPIYSYMRDVVVYPNEFAYGYIHTNPAAPFFHYQARVHCFWF